MLTPKAEVKLRLSLLVAILCVSSAGCHRHSSLREPLRKVVQSGATQWNISGISDFDWVDLFVFGPYTPKDAECQTLKHSASQCKSEGLRDVDENESLMVFLHDGSVIRVESIPRTIVDFNDNCLNKDFTREIASFFIEKRPRVSIVCR